MEIAGNKVARPFLKWAGGKRQLLTTIDQSLPVELAKSSFIYIEPFVGSGAVLFWMLNQFPKLKGAVINDINPDLSNAYKVIASKPKKLISTLSVMQNEYHSLEGKPKKKADYYYNKRDLFNTRKENKCVQAALFIFLNRTCFNGLYRVNSANQFNVPLGSYKKPMICDESNIMLVSKALEQVEILNGDFEETLNYAGNSSFFYFDPPYKPLSKTSSFNSYSKQEFNDKEQFRLKDFCVALNKSGFKWMLSNSDPGQKFFDKLYSDFFITRVRASRNINSDSKKRGKITEVLITNYKSNNISR